MTYIFIVRHRGSFHERWWLGFWGRWVLLSRLGNGGSAEVGPTLFWETLSSWCTWPYRWFWHHTIYFGLLGWLKIIENIKQFDWKVFIGWNFPLKVALIRVPNFKEYLTTIGHVHTQSYCFCLYVAHFSEHFRLFCKIANERVWGDPCEIVLR